MSKSEHTLCLNHWQAERSGKVTGGKRVYIEFWGRESDPKYRERMAAKKAIYARHNLRLIELGDAEIERLDDVLPRMLLRFGIESV